MKWADVKSMFLIIYVMMANQIPNAQEEAYLQGKDCGGEMFFKTFLCMFSFDASNHRIFTILGLVLDCLNHQYDHFISQISVENPIHPIETHLIFCLK